MEIEPASVHAFVCVFTLSNMNIPGTSWPIATKFYQSHDWGGGKAAISFGPDLIITLVSMLTDSSHRVIMAKMVSALFSSPELKTHR